ncbi:MAG: hypothetical protein QOD42_2873, partial [Sphingomonadales bacterium]|nr:hypothetical protein [Sphingomonadales bacterium]
GDPPDCFPQVLRAFGRDGTWHEPLATDLRRHRDGPRLGLLKLVAGITGVGLDALVQRDAARKIRRVMAVTGAALVAMLATAALALVAINARGEAERQRAEADRQRAAAEGQIEFMLTDLRDRLRGVGSIEIMSIVNRQALDYYGRQQLAALGPDSLERRARVLLAMGEDESTRGHLDQALAAFREAHKTTASLLDRSPNDPERIFAHSQSEYWVGSIDQQRGNYHGALAAYERYRTQAARMNELAPNNPRYIGELAYSESNLGIVSLTGFHRPINARQHFERSLRSFLHAAEMQPTNPIWRVEAADAHAWIASTWSMEGRHREARVERLEEQRLKLALIREDPANRTYRYAAVIAARSLARMDIELREFRRALAQLDQTRLQMAALLALDPENLVWRHQAVRIEIDSSLAYAGLGNSSEKRRALRRALSLLSAASSAPPESSEEHRQLGTWLRAQLSLTNNQFIDRR